METITTSGTSAAHRTLLAGIRQTLGTCLPGTEFRYAADYRQGHCRIRVMYTDGASLRRVQQLVRGFNRKGPPGADASRIEVTIERQMSAGTRELLLHEIRVIFRYDRLPREDEPFEPIRGTVGEYMEKIFRMRDF